MIFTGTAFRRLRRILLTRKILTAREVVGDRVKTGIFKVINRGTHLSVGNDEAGYLQTVFARTSANGDNRLAVNQAALSFLDVKIKSLIVKETQGKNFALLREFSAFRPSELFREIRVANLAAQERRIIVAGAAYLHLHTAIRFAGMGAEGFRLRRIVQINRSFAGREIRADGASAKHGGKDRTKRFFAIHE